jgi:hypothetical protein
MYVYLSIYIVDLSQAVFGSSDLLDIGLSLLLIG